MFDFIFETEDQRDWQKRPGCHSNPFSCFFCHLLSVFNIKTVLDLTYGVGSFYEKCGNSINIIAVDIVKWDWLVRPMEFHKSEAYEFIKQFNGKVDAVVLDPPYRTERVNTRHNNEFYDVLYFGNMPMHEIIEIIKLARAKAKYVILKYMPDNGELIKLLELNPKYVITWRYIISHVKTTDNNKVIRNSTKIFIY